MHTIDHKQQVFARVASDRAQIDVIELAHPGGLANGSVHVERNDMRHNNAAFMAVLMEPNEAVFPKTAALNDFYFRADDWPHPMGCIQTLGKSHGESVRGEALPTNRITLARDGRVTLDVIFAGWFLETERPPHGDCQCRRDRAKLSSSTWRRSSADT